MVKKFGLIISILVFVTYLSYVRFNYLKKYNQSNIQNIIQITTSFYPLYFFTSQIGGNLVNVVNITKNGIEPHEYEPTIKDIQNIQNSKLLITIGSGFEPWFTRIKSDLRKSKIELLEITQKLNLIINNNSDENIIYDPHVWLSPKLALKLTDNITSDLIHIDPKNLIYYQKNADMLKNKLSEIDREYKIGLAHCQINTFITSHAAFSYLARDYNLIQIPISGINPESEPSPKQIEGIINIVKQNKINYIFFETLVNPKLSETIAGEVHAQTLVLNPIEGLTNEEIKNHTDYFSLMENNLKNLRIALACQ
jgi:zinc transport system substrate-binding protein